MTNFFENAKNITINNKEVKDISINNNSIWAKEKDYLVLVYNKTNNNTISIGTFETNGDVIIDWGDNTTTTVNNPQYITTHEYVNDELEYTITFKGNITRLYTIGENYNAIKSAIIPNSVIYIQENYFKNSSLSSIVLSNSMSILSRYLFSSCTNLTSIIIPNSITSIEEGCFTGCRGLTSINIPNSVTSIGSKGFYGCKSLINYQLYWEDSAIIQYDSNKMPNNTNTIFTIPNGQITNYVAKGYPSDKLVERNE